ncbi:MAG: peptide-methionine (R)-S-oxide reductase [Sphingomonadales bacterium]|jgi:peptide-methionine (R)-S-oxide reductase|nr:peptide-methionine (R)-S-oxide reductase [Sphingomonadales bacterium]
MSDNNISRRRFIGSAAAIVAVGTAGFVVFGKGGGVAEAAERFEVTKSAAEWRRILGPQRYAVLREAHTERAGSSPLDREHRRGTFLCAGCDLPVYASAAKFDSGTGWPSFTRPLPGAVRTRVDNILFIARTEVHCRRCGGHLGHVFDDGPPPTGKRFCMNGLALKFRPA